MGCPRSSCPEGGDTHCPPRLSPLVFPISFTSSADKRPDSFHFILEVFGQAQLEPSGWPASGSQRESLDVCLYTGLEVSLKGFRLQGHKA